MTNGDAAGDSDSGVYERIHKYISSRFLDGSDEIDGSTPLLEWGVLSSMNIAQLMVFIRDELGVTVPPDQIVGQNFKDLNAITDMVLRVREGQ